MADLDQQTLTKAFEQALKNRGVGGSGGGSFSGGPASTVSKPVDFSTGLGNVASKLETGLGKFTEDVKKSLDVWRELSRSGANFSNDLIGLSTSAANSRMSLRDFADVIKGNNKQFAGLGGSVAKGSQAFADLSKGFFDSKMDLQLRNLAYTTKEMNEVLAIQIGNTRSSTALDEQGRKKSYEAAALMATEMDMTSKLMGKSREQQMEEMKLRQTDAQVQAKIRLESQKMRSEGKTEAEIAAYKTNVMNSLQKATNEGVGQAAKEMFTTGAATSKTGQMQAGLMGGQVAAVAEEQRAIRRGDTGAAKEASARATAEAIKSQNDPTILSLTALGDAAGAYSSVLEKSFTSMQTFNDALESVAQANKLDLNDKKQAAEAYKLAREKVEKADVEDMKKKESGAVKGALSIERGAQELTAGAANAASAITKGGKSIADALNNSAKAIADSIGVIEGTNKKKSLGAQIGEAAGKSGLPQPQLVKGEKEGQLAFEQRQKDASGGAIGEAVNVASNLANKASDKLNAGLSTVAEAIKLGPITPTPVKIVDIKARAGGGFVQSPEINLIGEAGPEWVLNKEQMGKTLENAARQGVEQASSMMPKIPSGGNAGLNLSEILNVINKSFSSIKSEQHNQLNMLGEDQEKLFTEFSKLSKDKMISEMKNIKKTTDILETTTASKSPNIAQTSATTSALDDKTLPADTNPYASSNVTSDIAAGMKAANKLSEPSAAMSGVNAMINSWNAPKSTDLKAAGATIPAEAKKDAEKHATQSARDAADALKEKAFTANPVAPTGAKTESTLNDVVKSLERLNTQMGQLINQHETIGRQQTKAIKSNSTNVYDRT